MIVQTIMFDKDTILCFVHIGVYVDSRLEPPS